MTAVSWHSLSGASDALCETKTRPYVRPPSSLPTVPEAFHACGFDPDDVKTRADGAAARAFEDVRTKLSGRGARGHYEVKTRPSAYDDRVPESRTGELSVESERLAADASGERLVIPALSLRSVIAGAPLQEIPLDAPAPPAPLLMDTTKLPPLPEPTEAVDRRRSRGRCGALAWFAGGALMLAGALGSTTDAAETFAARLAMHFEGDAIPAATADAKPSAMIEPSTAIETPPAQEVAQAPVAPVVTPLDEPAQAAPAVRTTAPRGSKPATRSTRTSRR